MRWFYYVVLGLALFTGVAAATSRHWGITIASGAVLLWFVLLGEEGI